MRKILKPEIFKGSLKKNNYFEGWYFKHVSENLRDVYAIIPGISLNEDHSHSFIQVINGITGVTHYVSYPLKTFNWKSNRFLIEVGNSVFTDYYIDLDISDKDIEIKGKLEYTGITRFPVKMVSPGIMGWYAWIPFMECYHGIVSASHRIHGELHINAETVNFNGGKGYIEKNWGTSFPESWIWIQSNSFVNSDASLFISIAKIPWLGKFFIGFISFLYLDGKYYRFATYKNSKIESLARNGKEIQIRLRNHSYFLEVMVRSENTGELYAPLSGKMIRTIKESIDSRLNIKLVDKKGNVLFNGSSKRTGLEFIDRIFEYFPEPENDS